MKEKHLITLVFDSAEEKSLFLGQLCDGWGENYVDLTWDYGTRLDQAEFVKVVNTPDYE